LISVIIPAYNAENSIRICLEALKNQSIDKNLYEVIVVNDGSLDRTAEVAKRYDCKVISQKQGGPAKARNTGVFESNGDIILFTDSDCEPDEHWIKEMIKPFDDPHVVGVKGIYKTKQKSIVSRFIQVEFEERYKMLSKQDNIDFVDTYSAGFRKSSFLEVGGFDPNFPVASNEDVDLSYKIALTGKKMVFNPKAVVYHSHLDTWKDYLKLKFTRAYWRMNVYKRFPKKIFRDSYTPQILKIQIPISLIATILLPLCLIYPNLLPVFFLSFALFCLSAIPFFFTALKLDNHVAITSPVILYLKSLSFSLGIIAGALSQKRRDFLFPLLRILSDLLICNFSLIIIFYIRYYLPGFLRLFGLSGFADYFDKILLPSSAYFVVLPFLSLIWIIVFSGLGLYHHRRSFSRINEFMAIFKGITVIVLIFMAGSFLYKFEFSRTMIILYWILNLVFMNLARMFIGNFQMQTLKKGYNVLRVLIVGSGETGRMVQNKITNFPGLGYKLVGFVQSDKLKKEDKIDSYPVLGFIDDLPEIIKRERVEEIFIADPTLLHKDILNLICKCESLGVSFRIVSDLLEIMTSQVDIDEIADIPLIDLKDQTNEGIGNYIKIIFDYSTALILLIIISPLFIFIAFLIKASSKGPILLKLERLGKEGKPFLMYKFRTINMPSVHILDDLNRAKSIDFTSIGRALDASGLDEIPQLVNVLKGEMSLVGPRPEMLHIVKDYDLWQKKRLDVKPGITGLWQIYGRKDVPITINMEYDFYYIKNRSFLLDFTILLKTIPMMLFGLLFNKRE
jgi:exopolysaccharide biosynthesis polyprenyl glycosylphosphotransferase